MLERFVEGRELAVAILCGVVRCRSSRRCRAGASSTTSPRDTRSDARISSARPSSTRASRRTSQRSALDAWRLLDCRGFARVDLILGAAGPTLLEINAIPGLTDTSLLPQAADAAGLQFEDVIRRVLDDALAEPAAGPQPSSDGEVLRRDLVEELLELLDDVVGVLDLVLELDRRVGDHLLGREDRRADPDGKGDRVARARVDLELAARRPGG